MKTQNNKDVHKMLVVKQVRQITEDNRVYYINEEDNKQFIYFNILSSHYLRNYTFRMDVQDFHFHFHNEALDDVNIRDVFVSRNWLFPMKIDWWNFNINSIEFFSKELDINEAIIYNAFMDEYCNKFNCGIKDFKVEHRFFDDLLTHYKVNAGGKLTPYKNKKRKK